VHCILGKDFSILVQLTQDTRLDAAGDVNAVKFFPEFFRKTTALLLFDLCLSGDVCHILHLLMESMTENWDLSPVSCQNIFFSLANKSQKLATLTKTNKHQFGLQLSEHRWRRRGQVLNWCKMTKVHNLKGLQGTSNQFMLAEDPSQDICLCVCRLPVHVL